MRFDVIFCDDIRTEASGKLLVIGMYGGVLGVAKPLTDYPLAILLRLRDVPKGKQEIAFKLTTDDGATKGDGIVEFEAIEDGAADLLLGRFPISMKDSTVLRFLCGKKGDKIKQVDHLQLRITEVTVVDQGMHGRAGLRTDQPANFAKSSPAF